MRIINYNQRVGSLLRLTQDLLFISRLLVSGLGLPSLFS